LNRGAWVAQSLKHPTLDFDAGHDLMVPKIEPSVGLYADTVQSLLGILSLSSLPFPLLSLSLSK
ncbi:hypothetical protein NEIPOLOT_01390, partial [Neisseria polysaccharea ATCC 43768]